MKFALLATCTIILCSCDYFKKQSNGDAFQLVSSSDGLIYKLDKATGETWLLRDAEMTKVNASLSAQNGVKPGEPFKIGKYTAREVIPGEKQLNVGTFYKTEDGRLVRYNGQGSFSGIMNAVLVVGKTYKAEGGKLLTYKGKQHFEAAAPGKSPDDFGSLEIGRACYAENDEIFLYDGEGKLKKRPPLKKY